MKKQDLDELKAIEAVVQTLFRRDPSGSSGTQMRVLCTRLRRLIESQVEDVVAPVAVVAEEPTVVRKVGRSKALTRLIEEMA